MLDIYLTMRQAAVASLWLARLAEFLVVGPKGPILVPRYFFRASVKRYA